VLLLSRALKIAVNKTMTRITAGDDGAINRGSLDAPHALQHLHLRDTGMGEVGALAISSALAINCSLRSLDIDENKSSASPGAHSLAKGLAQNLTLTSLSLRACQKQALAQNFQKEKSWTTLDSVWLSVSCVGATIMNDMTLWLYFFLCLLFITTEIRSSFTTQKVQSQNSSTKTKIKTGKKRVVAEWRVEPAVVVLTLWQSKEPRSKIATDTIFPFNVGVELGLGFEAQSSYFTERWEKLPLGQGLERIGTTIEERPGVKEVLLTFKSIEPAREAQVWTWIKAEEIFEATAEIDTWLESLNISPPNFITSDKLQLQNDQNES
jgi:hypothetical protein